MTDPRRDSDPEVVLDVSRLLSRLLHNTPTGVDRVEMAYARGLSERLGGRLRYGAVHLGGIYGRIPARAVERFLDRLEAEWDGRTAQPQRGLKRWWSIAKTLWLMRPRRIGPGDARIYVQSSPHHLHDERLVRTILRREKARFVCLLHDLIPIEYPEYARPGGSATHLKRIETVARHADAVIANSAATRLSFLPYLGAANRNVPVTVAHLGIHEGKHTGVINPAEPYFICLGTIEPRKNHLLLLNIWRHMAASMESASIPKLVIVGRRGWENEQIVDMLDRCPALDGHVEEINDCSDRRMYGLLRNARALLMPSFAEGYGMPVAESLSVGTPVIASDLPALREAGGVVPDFLDPLDGPAWKRLILDHHTRGSLHIAQLARMDQWRCPSWGEHIRLVCEAISAEQR